MKKYVDIKTISKLLFLLVVYAVVIIIWISLDRLDKVSSVREEYEVSEIIEKALVQCYALEGSYPSDIEYLKKYGIIFNTDKYIYYYETLGQLRPTVKVVSLNETKINDSYFGGKYE